MLASLSSAMSPDQNQQTCSTRVIRLNTCHGSRSGTKCRACFPAIAMSVGSRPPTFGCAGAELALDAAPITAGADVEWGTASRVAEEDVERSSVRSCCSASGRRPNALRLSAHRTACPHAACPRTCANPHARQAHVSHVRPSRCEHYAEVQCCGRGDLCTVNVRLWQV